eukprot:74977-Chlamydomonas_euryale.AAC.1
MRRGSWHTRIAPAEGHARMKPSGQPWLWNGVNADVEPSTGIGCGVMPPRPAKSHSGDAPLTKSPQQRGPVAPVDGSVYASTSKRDRRGGGGDGGGGDGAAPVCGSQSSGTERNATPRAARAAGPSPPLAAASPPTLTAGPLPYDGSGSAELPPPPAAAAAAAAAAPMRAGRANAWYTCTRPDSVTHESSGRSSAGSALPVPPVPPAAAANASMRTSTTRQPGGGGTPPVLPVPPGCPSDCSSSSASEDLHGASAALKHEELRRRRAQRRLRLRQRRSRQQPRGRCRRLWLRLRRCAVAASGGGYGSGGRGTWHRLRRHGSSRDRARRRAALRGAAGAVVSPQLWLRSLCIQTSCRWRRAITGVACATAAPVWLGLGVRTCGRVPTALCYARTRCRCQGCARGS